jgi:hypothetical protein
MKTVNAQIRALPQECANQKVLELKFFEADFCGEAVFSVLSFLRAEMVNGCYFSLFSCM